MMRLVRVAIVALSIVGAGASLEAQSLAMSAGPAMRLFDAGTGYVQTEVNGFAVDVAIGMRVATNLRAIVGGGLVVAHDPNVYAPLPPGSEPCGCEAAEQLYQGRVGLAYERGPVLLGSGVVVADAGEIHPVRFGGFAELRLRPLRAVPFVDVGVLAYRLTRSTGRQRALVLPTIGLRF